MKIFKTKFAIREFLSTVRSQKIKIGLVPTMGALHDGHLSLVAQSKANCVITIVSIFVNPTQFNNSDDLKKYPKPLEKDIQLLENAGCDILFSPEVDEMYSETEDWGYEVGPMSNILEGKFRPGHYKGVTQIVFKLFDLIKPDSAFFGQKDYQQFLVISKMSQDLNLNIDLIACPIIREADGLAMSSRNIRLSASERNKSLALFKSLEFIRTNFHQLPIDELLDRANLLFEKDDHVSLEYLKICDMLTLEEIHSKKKQKAIALIACMIGETRLIDNMILS
ncbi:MAG: pantoate--beta-alanine ligase [Bacteroidetes bacterium]|nr:pantoate--beta-alanine ligase [Bacteroidota bacterium]MBU1371881.1 pantoate--beta-alanine ligase [Bacteroidota bacterium]MBU1483234.1 pantoate--beta-alanine ligase [Bacteroidota bacterium]MBU1759413.1 pantoate--beta-alanine ligase [Bacteroidota bacterium]MBU2046904.1 pantoate--beta-alanine ligase [Bacteroidota bacterium]